MNDIRSKYITEVAGLKTSKPISIILTLILSASFIVCKLFVKTINEADKRTYGMRSEKNVIKSWGVPGVDNHGQPCSLPSVDIVCVLFSVLNTTGFRFCFHLQKYLWSICQKKDFILAVDKDFKTNIPVCWNIMINLNLHHVLITVIG